MPRLRTKKIHAWTLLLYALVFAAVGMYAIAEPDEFIGQVFRIAGILLAAIALVRLAEYLRAKIVGDEERKVALRQPVFLLALSALFLYLPGEWLGAFVTEIFAVLCLIHAAFRAVLCWKCFRDDIREFWSALLFGVGFLALGIGLLIGPLTEIVLVSRLIGAYLILYGANNLFDFWEEAHAQASGRPGRRRPRLALPMILAAFIPHALIERVNWLVEQGYGDVLSGAFDAPEAGEVGMEIFIHLKSGDAFGHADLCFENKIYSYGTYDHHAHMLGGFLSDGVWVKAEREAYIEHSVEEEQKVLVGFGLKLTAEQRRAVHRQIARMRRDCREWLCDLQLRKVGRLKKDTGCTDAASLLYADTHCRFFKFRRGRFKTYFAVNSNCVLMVDAIAGAAGIDTLNTGFITPGTYYQFLDGLYSRANSFVVAKTVYTKQRHAMAAEGEERT